MENVGESKSRNEEFKRAFSRPTLIMNAIKQGNPTGRIPVIFDVGGHTGESVVFLRSLFPDAMIYSFEPDPDSWQKLQMLEDKNSLCLNMALADYNGHASFFRNRISHTSSLYEVNLESNDSIYQEKVRQGIEAFEENRFNQEIGVAVRRLDDVCNELLVKHIDLLKVDVQGAEAKVLSGSGKMLANVSNVIVEVSFYDYYIHRSSFLEIEQILAPWGLKLYSITELSNNPMNGRTDWAEVLYCADRTPWH